MWYSVFDTILSFFTDLPFRNGSDIFFIRHFFCISFCFFFFLEPPACDLWVNLIQLNWYGWWLIAHSLMCCYYLSELVLNWSLLVVQPFILPVLFFFHSFYFSTIVSWWFDACIQCQSLYISYYYMNNQKLRWIKWIFYHYNALSIAHMCNL